jgi:RES domain-containing protein
LLAAIADAARASETTEILAPLFRARTTADGLVDRELGAFDFPPARCAKEGRYNHAGCPVLYLGSDVETCHAELRGAPCLAIEFRLLVAIKILDLTDPFVSHEKQADLLNTVVWSAMLSAKQEDIGAYNPHYIFSRFVADCARAAGFHAIRYPSTRVEGFNLVIVDGIHTLKGAAEVLAYHERP